MPNVGDDELPNRQNPSPGVHTDLGRSNFVLLTVTTEKRDPWLANDTAHRLLHETWSEAKAWLVGDYLLMPDHLHCFCAPHDLKFTIETWISYWKREFALKRKRLARTLAPPPTNASQVVELFACSNASPVNVFNTGPKLVAFWNHSHNRFK